MKGVDRDFSDLLSAFNDAGVRYLIVGAHALAVHGRARATKDLDIWVASDAENAAHVFAALAKFGAPLEGMEAKDFCEPEIVFQIGVAPVRIDIMTTIDGIEFNMAWKRRMTTTYGAVDVSVIGREDFIANKRATGRAQDLADIEALTGR